MPKVSLVEDSGVDIPDMVDESSRREKKTKVPRKWGKWLHRERDWDESRWECYMRYWKYRMRMRSHERDGEGSKRRRYFEKAREAYSAYCKRFETCVGQWSGFSTSLV
jgi:hypothetical protein